MQSVCDSSVVFILTTTRLIPKLSYVEGLHTKIDVHVDYCLYNYNIITLCMNLVHEYKHN